MAIDSSLRCFCEVSSNLCDWCSCHLSTSSNSSKLTDLVEYFFAVENPVVFLQEMHQQMVDVQRMPESIYFIYLFVVQWFPYFHTQFFLRFIEDFELTSFPLLQHFLPLIVIVVAGWQLRKPIEEFQFSGGKLPSNDLQVGGFSQIRVQIHRQGLYHSMYSYLR